MSRGPGRHQAAILDEIAETGYAFVTVHTMTEAVKVARRRAARRLESLGSVVIAAEPIAGTTSNVCYPPGTDVGSATVTGTDGKRYHVPR